MGQSGGQSAMDGRGDRPVLSYARCRRRGYLSRAVRAGVVILGSAVLVLACGWLWLYRGWKTEQKILSSLPQHYVRTEAIWGLAGLQNRLGAPGFVLDRAVELITGHIPVYGEVAPPKLMTDSDVEAMCKLRWLREVRLNGTAITDRSLASLSQLPRLQRLHVGWTAITDEGLRIFSPKSQLEILSLRQTRVTDAGMEHLAKITSLQYLNLCETDVGDEGLRQLAPLRNLRRVGLIFTKVSAEGLLQVSQFSKLNYVRTVLILDTELPIYQRVKSAAPNVGFGGDRGPEDGEG